MRSSETTKTENKARKSGAKFCAALLKVCFALLPVAALVAYVNFTVDPGNLYGPSGKESVEYQISSLLLSGKNATGVWGYDDRLMRRLCLEGIDEAKQTVVLGSSRALLIDSEMLGTDDMFNFGCTGGVLEDYIGFYGLLSSKQLLPKRVIISIDPWLLNDNYTDERFSSTVGDGYYYYMTQRLGLEADASLNKEPDAVAGAEQRSFWSLDMKTKLNVLSPSYFQAALYKLSAGKTDAYYTATDERENDVGVVRSDGSFAYPQSYCAASTDEKIQRASTALPDNIIGLEDLTALRGRNYELLKSFIKAMQADGCRVDMLMLPMSNTLFDYMKSFERYALFFEAEDVFYELAAETGCGVYGTFDPYAAGFDMSAFYDGYHPSVQAVTLLAAELLAGSDVS